MHTTLQYTKGVAAMKLNQQKGSIEVICGSMFSGKSEELIRRVRRAQFAKQRVIVFKPQLDKRYSEEAVVSHNGTSLFAIPIEQSSDVYAHIHTGLDIVAIDEAQFFDNGIVEVVQKMANNGLQVIIAGLDQNFRGEPFGSMPTLMAIAEELTKLHAVCTVCGAPASRTQRLINGEPAGYDDPLILVGAEEAYEARCRHHHIVPQGSTSQNKRQKILNKK